MMRAHAAWTKLEELVIQLAKTHRDVRFTAVIDTFGRCSIAVNKSSGAPVDGAREALDAEVELARWLGAPSVLSYKVEGEKGAEKDALLRRVIERQAQTLGGADAPNAFRLSRTLGNEGWRQPPSSNPDGWPKVIGFYSFKGGVGRSTAAAISALLMAREGKRVLLVDLDLEAPGLEGYFGFSQDTIDGGMVELLLEQAAMSSPWAFNPIEHRLAYVADSDVQNRGGLLHIVPAGVLDKTYPERLGRLALADLARTPGKDNPMRVVLQRFIDEEGYDLILVDCRTGFSELGGMTLNGLADLNVLMFKAAESERRYVEVVLDHMARLSAPRLTTPEEARQLANSLLFVFSMAQLPADPEEARAFDRELRERVSSLLWERVFGRLPPGVWDQPDITDEDSPDAPVPHDVIVVPYQRDLPALTRAADMQFNAARGGVVTAYEQLTRRILDVKLALPTPDAPADPGPPAIQGDVVTALATLINAVHAEEDLNGPAQLTERFLPRPAHRELLSSNVLVIQGAKGSGKSALFVAFQDQALLLQLARYAGVPATQQQRLLHTTLMAGFDESLRDVVSNGVTSLFKTFQARQSVDRHETLRCYWRVLLCARLLTTLRPDDALLEGAPPLSVAPTIDDAVKLSMNTQAQGELIKWLRALMDRARALGRELWVLYDGLDAHLSSDPQRRGPLVSALVDLWWGLRGQPISARIFLREDVWDREVKLVDKSKVTEGAYRVRLSWDGEELYRLLIKRLLSAESFQRLLRDRGLWRDSLLPQPGLERLGMVPPTDKEWLQGVIAALIGDYMGATKKKGETYSWIIKHLGDSKGRVRPRSLLLMFATAARRQGEDVRGRAPLRQERLKEALRGEVSASAVAELREEFREEWTHKQVWVPEKFLDCSSLWPVDYKTVRQTLKSQLKLPVAEVDELLQKMIDGGLLEWRETSTGDKLQVPDIYLYGLGLTRKG